MAKVDFCFSGWVRGAEITTVTHTVTGQAIELTPDVTSEDLAFKLKTGEWTISLGDYLYDRNADSDIEMFDFEKGEE